MKKPLQLLNSFFQKPHISLFNGFSILQRVNIKMKVKTSTFGFYISEN